MKLPTLNFGLVASAVLGFGLIGLSSTPAAAQGTMSPFAKPRNITSCPSGWTDRGTATCYPGSSARPSYFVNGACASGYGKINSYCIEGADRDLTRASTGTLVKANRLDRCPISYFTNPENPANCISLAANATTARLKGSAPCRTGEIDDWGIYCVSNYSALTRGQANYGLRDWNAIYSSNGAQSPRQADLPEGTEYTPAYITIFGRVKTDGSPMSGGSPAATPAAAATPASTRPSRTSGTTSPQLRTAASFLCPETWVGGLAGTRNGNENMCYPQPGAAAAYPRQTEAETCAAGYVLSGTWCIAGNYVGSPAATQAQAQTPPNCPAPSQASAAGQALGGLLGGRRGNSQAGAMLGGLLGAAAAGAAKPAGCP